MKEVLPNVLSSFSKEELSVLSNTSANLANAGIEKNAKKFGDVLNVKELNNYKFLDSKNEKRNLSSILNESKKGLILVMYRGSWCPYCNFTLAAHARVYNQYKELGYELVAITGAVPESTDNTIQEKKIPFSILSDVENKFSGDLGLNFTLTNESLLKIYKEKFGINFQKEYGNESHVLRIPATYVIKKNGEIIFSHVDADYTKRGEPKEVLKVLQQN